RGPASVVGYAQEFRGALARAAAEAQLLIDRRARTGCLREVERTLTEQHADAVMQFLARQGLSAAEIDVIGFHGQTVLHKTVLHKTALHKDTPPVSPITQTHALTVQLGDGPLLARLTGIDVVYDLRAADAAAGGEGAPLAPIYHRALAGKLPERPVAVLNIGGVANVTWIGRCGELIAFDTGPGNALIDDWMLRRQGSPHDEGGALASRGRVHDDRVRQYLRHPYFGAPPPKSLDRNAFALALVDHLAPADGAATLTAFTAASIAAARAHFPKQPQLWVISGGGRRNRTLMAMIAERVENAVIPAEAAGMDGDAVEAEAWAYLAVRSLKGLPITFPGTTGVAKPLTGGVLARA
ncbi:MAG TPA: anhydro-N-acetylmuramic acid kinase, partial [Hyphomicrobiaceae bacterium]|nr:anhydro-N-acetylmuramic acid kinase [Hyphomicrobiaceae bacterium]